MSPVVSGPVGPQLSCATTSRWGQTFPVGPLAGGVLGDRIGIHHAFILSALCYTYIAYYGYRGSVYELRRRPCLQAENDAASEFNGLPRILQLVPSRFSLSG
jgi:hypothetical protein